MLVFGTAWFLGTGYAMWRGLKHSRDVASAPNPHMARLSISGIAGTAAVMFAHCPLLLAEPYRDADYALTSAVLSRVLPAESLMAPTSTVPYSTDGQPEHQPEHQPERPPQEPPHEPGHDLVATVG